MRLQTHEATSDAVGWSYNTTSEISSAWNTRRSSAATASALAELSPTEATSGASGSLRTVSAEYPAIVSTAQATFARTSSRERTPSLRRGRLPSETIETRNARSIGPASARRVIASAPGGPKWRSLHTAEAPGRPWAAVSRAATDALFGHSTGRVVTSRTRRSTVRAGSPRMTVSPQSEGHTAGAVPRVNDAPTRRR